MLGRIQEEMKLQKPNGLQILFSCAKEDIKI